MEGQLNNIFTPWRLTFILGKKPEKCVFCKATEDGEDGRDFVLYRGKTALVMLNRYPYSTGHLLIIPYAHKADLEELSEEELCEMTRLAKMFAGVLKKTLNPDGYNVGMNIGKVAGAGIADHVHLHVVPRWDGDTNFMPVLANVKIQPTDLEAVYKTLKDALPPE